MKNMIVTLVTVGLVSPMGFTKEVEDNTNLPVTAGINVQVTDYFEKKNEIVSSLMAENRSIEEATGDLLNALEQLKEARSSNHFGRTSQIAIAITGIGFIAAGKLAKSFNASVSKSANKIMAASATVTAVGAGTLEFFVRGSQKDIDAFTLQIEAEIEVLETKYKQNRALLETLRDRY